MRRLYTLHGHGLRFPQSKSAIRDQGITQLFGTFLTERASITRKGVRMRRVLFVMTLLIFVLAACAPGGSGATEEESAPGEGSTSTPADLTPAQRAAVTSL